MREQSNHSERPSAGAGVDHINATESSSAVERAQSANHGLPPGYFDGGLD